MPLFNWEANNWSSIVRDRFWMYWAVTVPSTAIVLILWRVWFKFDHWRMEKGEGSFWDDVRLWWKSRKPVPVDDGRSISTTDSYGSRHYE